MSEKAIITAHDSAPMKKSCSVTFRCWSIIVILASAAGAEFAAEPFAMDNPVAAAPRLAADNANWRLELAGFDGGRLLTIQAECIDGKWAPVVATLAGPKPPKADVAVTRMTVTDARVAGELNVTLATTNVTVELIGTVSFPDPTVWWPTLDHDPFGEGFGWWSVMAESQPATALFTGTWNVGDHSGIVTGRLTPRREPGRFDMGVAGTNGLELRFDMGRKRVNWNHARVAVYTFAKPVDLRSFAGLRVAVATSEPRRDVEVSVWLREADGSWYYTKAAIPLVTNSTEAFVDFRDLAEAEWVAPGSHVDEDYEFDRSSVTHFGVGVVNPLGVGRVTFVLRSVKVEGQCPPAPVARAVVTGRTLAVNGTEYVPPGLFGGYAYDLPQEYRPGCQRNLRFGPGGGPSVPDVDHARFFTNSFRDWKTMAGLLIAAEGGDPAAQIMALADEQQRKTLATAVAKGDDRTGAASLAQLFNLALKRREWVTAVAARQDAPREPCRTLRDDNASGTEKLVACRRLIESLWPGQIVPFRRATEAFYIDCMGDRFTPALNLRSASWKENIRQLGSNYAAEARAMGYPAVMEWWNEPYLDWARGTGAKNYNTNFYDLSKAEEGGPVTIKATGEVFDLLRWRKTDKGWRVYDPTQFGYFSGKANGRLYDDMIGVLGPAVKETGEVSATRSCDCRRCSDHWPARQLHYRPEIDHVIPWLGGVCERRGQTALNSAAKGVGGVTLVGGWGFRWHEDHWAAWELLYRPTIDRGIDWLDGICEHHYQGDTTAMTGSYEVLEAYAVAKHRKWLQIYNTECNDLVDAPSRGVVDTPDKALAATNYRRMTYNLRDIIYMILQVPDKAAGRTVIHQQATPEGTDAAYGMMADLRGRLVETGTDDPDLWCVSSVDGTDPRAIRDDGQRRLVTILFNDHREPVNVSLRVVPPAGTTLQPGTVEEITVDPVSWKVGRKTAPVEAVANAFTADLVLPARRAWKVEFPLTGVPPKVAQASRHQTFAGDILQDVTPGRPFKTTVSIEVEKVKRAKRAWLRMVLEDVASGEGWVDVGGRHIELPTCHTADNCNRIVEIPLPSVPSAGKLPVRFVVADGPHAGYRVDMVSVVVEEERR